MVVQSEKKECCFYVSEFHLEMILIPYINRKIDEDIDILTEKELRKTVEILISKINLNEREKEKILNLDWNGEKEIKENSNIIIIGTREYIEEKHKQIKNKNPLSILDCYDFEIEQNNMAEIIKEYDKTLNTLGTNNF